ncbi:MAG TPA: UrcA family protein [Rhizomicrobium sp.]|nr:UrcA family protein [Rhizomicrobium sp.]
MLRTIALTALLTLGATAAYADDASTQVPYSDLDLSQPADAKTLAARLQDAAAAVCLKANPSNVAPSAMTNCINASVAMAVSRIETNMDSDVHDKVSNVRSAMKDL